MFRKACLGIAATVVLISWLVTSCGNKSEKVESKGKIAKIGGEVRRVSAEEESQVCAENFCEPNYLYHINFGQAPTGKPDDKGETQDYSRKILNLAKAWEVTGGSREVIVAVVDTGVDYLHEDLKNNIWKNTAEEKGKPGVDDDSNGYIDDVYGWNFADDQPNGMDDHRHGTHCAGIIGAEKNGLGVIGVSPLVKVMPVKFLSADGSGDADGAIKAIRYATRMGAKVISNSWGGGGASQLLNEAFQDAQKAGAIVVAAAGNYSSDNDASPFYPAGYDGVIAVASTDDKDNLSGFSSYGKKSVMIAAPGSKIYSSVLSNSYGTLSGTSMACPQVSGALALALAQDPGATAAELKERLCKTAKPILLDSVTCGRMDVGSFLNGR